MIISKDLMQGDLIYNHRNWICPVIGIGIKEDITVIAQHYGESTYKVEDLFPIPISEDIILKLGWKEIKESDPNYKIRIGLGKQYKHPSYTKSLNIIQTSLSGLYYILNGEVIVRYLHDLQHILHHTVLDEIRYDYEKDDLYIYDPEFNRKIDLK